ncbi:ATP-dependent RNA helicase [Suicoccus acidiformans]|uniref:ATP-dependent RNA helicase CshA n=1 Tax=Suicoccus acidiformans TaxID=2036206 RepID=A0A347WHU4_9LACT|nr:DEAD/DEAH box helicase [Suicoccus acidiformans]AXY24651.1 ATP-dependent RNA helicase [Suicoccus acidiformans]
MNFKDLQLKAALLEGLEEMGFEEPTPIQQEAIPPALEGSDVVGQAQTGTGKTAAFGLPLLNQLDMDADYVQGLIITPTRELAIQVQEELYRLGKGLKARSFVVYGGSSIGKQIERLKRFKPQIVVGTPGRILDLMQRKVLKVNQLSVLILDEADEMLNMGFIDDMRAIIRQTPDSRQTLMFSATMSSSVKQLSEQFLHQPVQVKVKATQLTADAVDQYFVKCRDDEKFDILTRIIEVQNPTQAIVFCRTKKRVDEVGRALSVRGFNAELIHGDITQQKRTSVIREFRSGNLELLVATDVAARGLDISGVTHVYNYDIPQDPESYVHRIGRTGRAGQSGQSITFVVANEMDYLRTIETLTKQQMSPLRPPTEQEARAGQLQHLIDQINDKLTANDVQAYRNSAKLLLNHYEPNDLVSALLSEIITDTTDIDVQISPQKPLPRSGKNQRSRSKGRPSNYRKQRKGSGNRSRSGGGRRSNQGKRKQDKPNQERRKQDQVNRSNNFSIRRKQDS